MLLDLCATWASGYLGFVSLELCAIRVRSGPLWYQLVEYKMLILAYECSFGLMELWIQVLFLCSHIVWGLSVVMVLCFYFHAIKGCSLLTPEENPLGQILED